MEAKLSYKVLSPSSLSICCLGIVQVHGNSITNTGKLIKRTGTCYRVSTIATVESELAQLDSRDGRGGCSQ